MVSKTRALLLLPALLLAGCGSTNTATSQPAPIAGAPTAMKSLGLYELHIEGGEGKAASATVTHVGGGKLSAQEISNGLSFTTTAVSNSSTSTTVTREYAAAITMTNNSGNTISAPTFVPVEVANYTESGTYFTANQTFNSSGTAVSASGVLVVQASASGSTPLVADTGLTNADFAVPSGSSVTKISPVAWKSTTAVTNGSSQNVTFGFRIPANNTAYRFSVVFGVFDNTATKQQSNVVISQINGGGGNAGATYTNDYVELFNPTNAPVSLAGTSLQYASATGNFNTQVALSGSIAAKSYYLVAFGSGGAVGAALPAAQATSSTNISGTVGKLALASNTTAVTSPTDANVLDYVGYGTTASAFEGTGRAPVPSSSTSDFRAANGCTDTNNNDTDFTVLAPNPRNSSSAAVTCP